MEDKEYFSHLYKIASRLNKEFSLQAALREALEQTVHLLELETGWIWLVQKDNKSVYLAASYNLPPALTKYPERLSGWCYCIEKYLSDSFSEAQNISEITCSRLKDIKADTRDLKFHATVPIYVKGEKAGLLNLMSKETQQLDDKQLAILNTISELIGMSIQRTRLQENYEDQSLNKEGALQALVERLFQPRLDLLVSNLSVLETKVGKEESLQNAVELAQEMQAQFSLMTKEIAKEKKENKTTESFQYPTSPLSSREVEVLQLVKKGHTNKKIAVQLFISERTVKFHMSSILSKLYAETRTEAVDTALRRGLINL